MNITLMHLRNSSFLSSRLRDFDTCLWSFLSKIGNRAIISLFCPSFAFNPKLPYFSESKQLYGVDRLAIDNVFTK